MTIKQAVKRLEALGFDMSKPRHNFVGTSRYGAQSAEPFDFGKNHVLTTPFRDVFFAECIGGWYVTSHIKFQARDYRRRHIYQADIRNIFGGGSTLQEAIEQFETDFKAKVGVKI